MKKAVSLLFILVLVIATLSACGECKHEWLDANCKDPKTCALCGEEEGKKLGHQWQDATCETPQQCTVCGVKKVEPTGHNYDAVVLEPTEFEPGYTTFTCLNCGHSYVGDHTEALGYELTEGTMVFRTDGVAYLYGYGGTVVETYTGWMTEVYGINDNYEETAGGFALTVPWNIYADNWDITRVIIEDGVKPVSTAYWFFRCYNLRSVRIGDGIESLDDSIFNECGNLADISFSPNTQLKKIEPNAFSECYLSIDLPDTVTQLYDLPYSDNPIELHDGLICIGDNVLSGNNVLIPDTVTEIGVGNLEHLTIPEDHPHFKVIDNCLIQTETHTLVDTMYGFVIPDDGSVTALASNLFAYNKSLYGIDLPDCLVTVGESAFEGSDLSEIVIPDSVTTIGAGAFASCRNLSRVTMSSGLTHIAENTFAGCENLREITIPEGVVTIGSGAFSGCIQLAEVILPSSLNSIGEAAFATCWNLTQIELPEGLNVIGDFAFFGCGLESLHIPATVIEIGSNPVVSCDSLMDITVSADNTNFYIYDRCLVSKTDRTLIATFGLTQIPEGIESIGDYAFYYCAVYPEITLPIGVTHIGYCAFFGTDLRTLTLPDGVEYIDENAFGYVESLWIPDSAKFIGDMALEGAAEIYYAGTAEQWYNIEVKNQCSPGMEIAIICTDQTIYEGSWW